MIKIAKICIMCCWAFVSPGNCLHLIFMLSILYFLILWGITGIPIFHMEKQRQQWVVCNRCCSAISRAHLGGPWWKLMKRGSRWGWGEQSGMWGGERGDQVILPKGEPSWECVSLTTSGVSRVLRGTCQIKELNENKVNKNFKKKKSVVIFPG